MDIESIEAENVQGNETETLWNENDSSDWNGRTVTKEGSSIEIVPPSHFYQSRREGIESFGARIVLCGGEVSVRGSADTDGNKDVEVEVKAESADRKSSGSISGGISQDSDGNTSGKVEVDYTIRF